MRLPQLRAGLHGLLEHGSCPSAHLCHSFRQCSSFEFPAGVKAREGGNNSHAPQGRGRRANGAGAVGGEVGSFGVSGRDGGLTSMEQERRGLGVFALHLAKVLLLSQNSILPPGYQASAEEFKEQKETEDRPEGLVYLAQHILLILATISIMGLFLYSSMQPWGRKGRGA